MIAILPQLKITWGKPHCFSSTFFGLNPLQSPSKSGETSVMNLAEEEFKARSSN